MSKKFRRSPSPALVISILALVLAASGTAVAASKLVSGNSLIKKNSLSGNRLMSGSVTGKQIAISSLGKVPDAAKADVATSATSATTAGSAPISNVTYVTTANVPIQVDTTGVPTPVTANCPAGTTVIGGGATVASPANELIDGSSPASTTGWTAEIFNEGNGILTASVTAICAPAAATTP